MKQGGSKDKLDTRGHRPNTSIVLAAVHGLSGLFRAVSAVDPSLCRLLPTLSPSLIGHLASVDVKHQEIKTSDLWLFIHASNLLPSLPTPLPYIRITHLNH